jgi:cytochrome c peroxidase
VCTATYPIAFEAVWGSGSCSITWPTDVVAQCANAAGFVDLSLEDRAKVNADYDAVGLSVAAYEGSSEVNAFSSKFDLNRQGTATLSPEENRGFGLFMGKAKRARCHIASGRQPLFTDYTFDNLGIPKNPENPATIADPESADPGLGGFLASRSDYAASAADNKGKHKVPTVRHVALGLPAITKAYGHNGYFKSLEGIVHFYNTRDVKTTCPDAYTEAQALAANCWPAPEVAANVNDAELGNLRLKPDEEAAIVAFLKTLSDGFPPKK